MSFGFSIGDFLSAIELANKIRREFVNVPSQFKGISDKYAVPPSVESNVDYFNETGSGVSPLPFKI
jgi:hypothetical protein